MEIWKPIITTKNGVVYDYTNRYEVSNLGAVKNVKTGRILTQHKNYSGHYYVSLSTRGRKKHFYVHRLVAIMFIPNPNNYPVINHKDENKQNNCVENLEWCTVAYNTQYSHTGKKRSEETKRKISQAKKKSS